jgi:hypothetical protein
MKDHSDHKSGAFDAAHCKVSEIRKRSDAAAPAEEKILRMAAVCTLVGLSRSSVYNLLRGGRFAGGGQINTPQAAPAAAADTFAGSAADHSVWIRNIALALVS